MATATLLIIGSEMLDPSRPDANGPLARDRLASLGIALVGVVRVGDDLMSLASAFKGALAGSDIVLTSGGLGPTGDDLTREALASVLGRKVVIDETWKAELAKRYESRGRTLSEKALRQALVVEGSEPLANGEGLACGGWVETGGAVAVLLPGVPAEFRRILDSEVIPRLAGRFPKRPRTEVVRATAAGLPEADVEPVLSRWYGKPGHSVSILPHMGVLQISVTLTSPPLENLDAESAGIQKELKRGLGKHLVSLEGDALEKMVGVRLLERGWTLSCAESCSGGLISQKIVSVPGASRYYLGGICAYGNEAKQTLLGVPRDTLEASGAVSEETALAMARGARARFVSHCAVSTTGIAGPEGGSPEKPVGTVYMAVATPVEERVHKIFMPYSREAVMSFSAHYALYRLWRMLEENEA